MKIFNITEGEGKLITHLTADNSNYTVTYDHGKLIFTKDDRQYIIPETNADDIYFKRQDPNLDKRKFDFVEYRNIHRDTLPSDFGINNITDVEPSSSHFTNEITLGGVNDKVPVIAPNGVVIHVNGNVVDSGALVDNGDVIKFEIVASGSYETTSNYNVSIGDITRGFSINTKKLAGVNVADFFGDGHGVSLFQLDGTVSMSGTANYTHIAGSSQYVAGKFGNALNTSGQNLTFSFWAKIGPSVTFTGGWNGFVKAGYSYSDNADSGGSRDCVGIFYNESSRTLLHFGFGNSNGGEAGFNLSTEWQHIVLSRVGQNGYLYVNGNLVRSRVEGLPLNPLRYLSIGDPSGTHQGSGIYIDQMRIFTRGLSQAEAVALTNEV
jgi:hypothetical protein